MAEKRKLFEDVGAGTPVAATPGLIAGKKGARRGIRVAPYDDTLLLSYVLEGGLHGHGMDELARLSLGLLDSFGGRAP